MSIDLQVLILVSSILIPVIHGAVTNRFAPDWFKVAATLVLTGLASLLSMVIENQGILSREILITWGEVFIKTIAIHYGLFKPLSVTGSTGLIQRVTKGRGVGIGVAPLV